MQSIDRESMVDLFLQLNWESDQARHTDCYQAEQVNVWRDYLPPALVAGLQGKQCGERAEMRFTAGEAVPAFAPQNLLTLPRRRIQPRAPGDPAVVPQSGRFYPKGVLRGVAGIFSANVEPFRCVSVENGHVTTDLNHPLADRELRLSAVIGKVARKQGERGGVSRDWLGRLTSGPGMQARWRGRPSEYLSEGAFERADRRPDAEFYARPRLTQHLDDTALGLVRNTYGRFVEDGARVLDLMASWQSHLPDGVRFERLTGLGLNAAELAKNPRLTERVVHDLNREPYLPFEDAAFDAVVCSVSVEYLTAPLAVFHEVARVLRRDGVFVLTFSNRWFEPKVVRVWRELHEFERMGLVLEYFLRAGGFQHLQTYSVRGLPRPRDDKYAAQFAYADPFYAVWGQKR